MLTSRSCPFHRRCRQLFRVHLQIIAGQEGEAARAVGHISNLPADMSLSRRLRRGWHTLRLFFAQHIVMSCCKFSSRIIAYLCDSMLRIFSSLEQVAECRYCAVSPLSMHTASERKKFNDLAFPLASRL